jgi:hypothetical protein
VAWQTRRGAQAADIAYRLRADAGAVAGAVERIAASDAAREYLDVAKLGHSWEEVADGGSESVLIVTQGLSIGLFLLSLADGRIV